MTFTWVGDLATDLDKVRFHIGDTDEDGAWLADETINALIASEGGVGGAVVACLRYIISQLSRPDFRADWLQVSNAEARKGYMALLAEKRREFGVAAVSAEAVMTYRWDSDQNSDADYDGDGVADA